MSEHDLDTIDISIQQAKDTIEAMEALKRLGTNKDFKKIILEGYFENEASRTVLLKADPSLSKPEDQVMLDHSIIAIGQLRQYFLMINAMGQQALKAKEYDEETRQELLAEAI
jgi:hypothetical protein